MSGAPEPRCTGFAVAGGHSRRMGRDKALLPWGAGTLLDHTLARLAEVAAEVVLLPGPAPRYEERGVRIALDEGTDQGPLGGVAGGLAASARPLGLFLGIDLPRVPVALLRGLIERAAGWDAVVPVTPRGAEPLCAVYTRSCLEPIRRRLAAGERRVTAFWPDVRVRRLEAGELAAFGDPEALFLNVNTPEDYRAAGGSRE